jgi:prophage regulatory protein
MTSTTQQTRFIKLIEVKRLTSLSTSEIYRRLESDTFPPRIKLGTKGVVWVEQEIKDWMDKKIQSARLDNEGM